MKRLILFFKSIRYSLYLTYSSSKLTIIPYFLLNILNTTIPITSLYLINLLLDNLARGLTINYILLIIGIYILLIIIGEAVTSIINILYNTIFDKACHKYDLELSEKLVKLPLSIIDSSKGKDLVDDVRYTRNTAAALPYRIVSIVSLFYSFMLAFLSLFIFNIWFTLLFLILTVPGIIIDVIYDRKAESLRRKTAPDVRKFSYYRWILTDPWPAKDVRMYDLTEHIKNRYNEEKQKYRNLNKILDKKKLIASLIAEIIKRSGELVFIIFVVFQAINGNISIGKVALFSGYALLASNSFQNMTSTFLMAYTRTTEAMGRFFEFNKLQCPDENKGKRKLINFESLVFDNVYFKYPLTEKYILKGTSFTLKRGEKLSIIGINGAGKSTIIKLMIGLYQIESGKILINGIPITEYDIKDVRRLFSVLFQSFVQYPLTLRDNVSLSDLQRKECDSEIINALKRSGIYEECKKLEIELDTSLTRMFDDKGAEFSKGQWQKIALSRVYFKNSQIVIFDEPSASLDAEAEDKTFKNFDEISINRTGIMISHRISSARMASRIIVLNDGKILESGTHEELISLGGMYKKLYSLQKEKYGIKGEKCYE